MLAHVVSLALRNAGFRCTWGAGVLCCCPDCREGRGGIMQHGVIVQSHDAVAAGIEDCLPLFIRRALTVMD